MVFCYSKLMQLPLYLILILTVAFLHQNYVYWDFPGGPVIKSLCPQHRGPKFNPWSANYILQAATKSPHQAIMIQHSAMKIPHAAIKTRHSQKKVIEKNDVYHVQVILPCTVVNTTLSSLESNR